MPGDYRNLEEWQGGCPVCGSEDVHVILSEEETVWRASCEVCFRGWTVYENFERYP